MGLEMPNGLLPNDLQLNMPVTISRVLLPMPLSIPLPLPMPLWNAMKPLSMKPLLMPPPDPMSISMPLSPIPLPVLPMLPSSWYSLVLLRPLALPLVFSVSPTYISDTFEKDVYEGPVKSLDG